MTSQNSKSFVPISYSASTGKSNAEYREICTENNEALTSIFRVKQYGATSLTPGWIDLSDSTEHGKALWVPFSKKSEADIHALDNILYLDSSSVLCTKINGVIRPIMSSSNFSLVKEVNVLPSVAEMPHKYSAIVIHSGSLKWYDRASSTWKTVTST